MQRKAKAIAFYDHQRRAVMDTTQPGTMLVFLDETGHEEFATPGHRLFGFGGIAVMASRYVEQVRERSSPKSCVEAR